MKKITFLILLLITSIGFSQTNLEDFESTPISFTGFEGLGGANIVPNPSVDGNNGSATVAEMIVVQAGQPWQGADLIIQDNVIDITDPVAKPVTVDVYSTLAFTMYAEVDGSSDGGPKASADDTHTGSGWETLTFTFNEALNGQGVANGTYSKMSFFPNWNGNGWHDPEIENTVYIDNITGFEAAPPPSGTPPTTAAPDTPTFDPSNVISIYSDSFTDVASNFDAGWCGANSVEEIMIQGNATQAYLANACQGIVLDAGVDASGFNRLHVDVYIEDGTDLTSSVFNLKFVQQPGGAALEINLNVASTPALTAGSWISVDVPVDLTSFTGFKEFGITSNLNNKVWYDNLYVYVEGTASTDDFNTVELTTYPNPSNTDWNIKTSNSVITSVEVFNLLGKSVISRTNNSTDIAISTEGLTSGIYLARVTTDLGTKTIKLIKE